MYEKVNPSHPDKVADRIAGALVDMAYARQENPRVAVEVLIGHGTCRIISEASVTFSSEEVAMTVERIAGKGVATSLVQVPQDAFLANNQNGKLRCGDNGIFRGMPVTEEQKQLAKIAKDIYSEHPTDGKYILSDDDLVICQSCASREALAAEYPNATINPLGDWTGGIAVDSGATNRKLGSDMGDAVTGGGLCGKDLSKADVSVNIYCHLEAQRLRKPVEMYCAIGDETVNGIPYEQIVAKAREYITSLGGFERFSEWGLIR